MTIAVVHYDRPVDARRASELTAILFRSAASAAETASMREWKRAVASLRSGMLRAAWAELRESYRIWLVREALEASAADAERRAREADLS